MGEKYLTIAEVARILGFSRKHVYDMAQTGKLSGGQKVWGNRWRIPLETIRSIQRAREPQQ